MSSILEFQNNSLPLLIDIFKDKPVSLEAIENILYKNLSKLDDSELAEYLENLSTKSDFPNLKPNHHLSKISLQLFSSYPDHQEFIQSKFPKLNQLIQSLKEDTNQNKPTKDIQQIQTETAKDCEVLIAISLISSLYQDKHLNPYTLDTIEHYLSQNEFIFDANVKYNFETYSKMLEHLNQLSIDKAISCLILFTSRNKPQIKNIESIDFSKYPNFQKYLPLA